MGGRVEQGGRAPIWARRWQVGGLGVAVLVAAGCDPGFWARFVPDAGGGGYASDGGSTGGLGGRAMGTGGAAEADAGRGTGGSPGTGGAVADAGAAGSPGTGGGSGEGCAPPVSVPGAWNEVAAPAGLTSFSVRDAFALGPDDIVFAGMISSGSSITEARFLRWTAGCWSVELSVPLSTEVAAGATASVHGTGPDDLWAVAGQTIYHRVAGVWTQVDDGWRAHVGMTSSGTPQQLSLNRVRVAGPDDVWITETDNIFHRTSAGWTGYNFDEAPAPGSITYRYADIWIDSPSDVWVAGGSDVVGSTMDPAFVHHFDGASWTHFNVGKYQVYSVWRSGGTLWLAIPGNLDTSSGVTVQRTLRAFTGSNVAPTVPIAGEDPGTPISITRLWGRSAQDVWGAGSDLVHYDGTTWSLVTAAPAAVRSRDLAGAFVAGDPAATWVVTTSGPRFFRQPVASGVTTP